MFEIKFCVMIFLKIAWSQPIWKASFLSYVPLLHICHVISLFLDLMQSGGTTNHAFTVDLAVGIITNPVKVTVQVSGC